MSHLDVGAVRAGAVRLRWAADSLRSEGTRIDRAAIWLACDWHGAAADAAIAHLSQLAAGFRTLASAHEQAGEVLLSCAAGIERAQEMARREQQQRASQPQEPASIFHPGWRGHTGLLDESQGLEQRVIFLAVSALRELSQTVRAGTREPGPPPLSLAEQAVGVGVGAARSLFETALFLARHSGPRFLVDRDGWLQDTHALGQGLRVLVTEPTQVLPVLLGTDLLQEGRYGEWAGSLLPDLAAGVMTGGAAPLIRRTATKTERLAGAGVGAGSQAPAVEGLAPARPEVGGAVVPRQGALMAARGPSSVSDLTPQQRSRVLADLRRSPALPPRWSADRAVAAVMQAATRPLSSMRDGARVLHEGRVDGVTVRVSLTKDGVVDAVELIQDAHAER